MLNHPRGNWLTDFNADHFNLDSINLVDESDQTFGHTGFSAPNLGRVEKKSSIVGKSPQPLTMCLERFIKFVNLPHQNNFGNKLHNCNIFVLFYKHNIIVKK